MGRRPSSPNAVPRLRVRVRGSKRYYFYDHGGRPRREEFLGTDYGLAIKRWAELERADDIRQRGVLTFRYAADRFRAEYIPKRRPATQRQYHIALSKLVEFFDDPPGPLEAIRPINVRQFMTWRAAAPVSANRERALLSALWNWCRNEGYTDLPNPCEGIGGNSEAGRKGVYVEDDAYHAVLAVADAPLAEAMELAYLSGQRPSDTLKMTAQDVRDGVIHVQQGKTGARVRIAVQGALAELLARIAARKAIMPVHALRLIVDEHGRPLSTNALRYRFDRARERAGVDKCAFQFRDLRGKAGTDKADASGGQAAQRQLGHASIAMTETYIRSRRGDKVTPTK
jgi:integrase